MPPGSFSLSNRWTSNPSRQRKEAAASPAGPAPGRRHARRVSTPRPERFESFFRGDPLHLPNLHRAFPVHPRAVLHALVVAEVAGHEGKRISQVHGFEGFGHPPRTGEVDVLGNVLMDGTRLHAGGHEAIEHGKRARDRHGGRAAIFLAGSGRVERGAGSILRPADIHGLRLPGTCVRLRDLGELLHSPVPAGLQQLGCDRHGPYPGIQDPGEVPGSGSTGEGERQASFELRGQ